MRQGLIINLCNYALASGLIIDRTTLNIVSKEKIKIYLIIYVITLAFFITLHKVFHSRQVRGRQGSPYLSPAATLLERK